MTLLTAPDHVRNAVKSAIPRMRDTVERRTSKPLSVHIVIARPDAPQDLDQRRWLQEGILFEHGVADNVDSEADRARRNARTNCFYAWRNINPIAANAEQPDEYSRLSRSGVMTKGAVHHFGPFIIAISGSDNFDTVFTMMVAEALQEFYGIDGTTETLTGTVCL